MTPEQAEKLEEQAYARIIWGDAKKDVIDFLIGNGVSREEAERIVRESLKVRAAEIRKLGWRNLLVGGLMAAIGILGIYYDLILRESHYMTGRRHNDWAIFSLLVVIGLFYSVKGIVRLVQGEEFGSISSMD